MFVKLQVSKFYNLNEIMYFKIDSYNDASNPGRANIALYFIIRHPDDQINTTLYYGKDCTHDNEQFKEDIKELHRATHTKMWTDDRKA
jgi:hypothetical protein